jgi:nicotinamidase-related amidase
VPTSSPAAEAASTSDVAFHHWVVEDREIRRHVCRRGRKHAFETINPSRTALVVVDMVPFFVAESAYCRGIVPSINALAGELRGRGGVVAWVIPGYREPTARDHALLGPEAAELYARSGGDGEPADRVWSGLKVKRDDLVVEKTAHSAFFPGRCPLPELLDERGIDTVIVTGTITNVCVEATVRDASTLGHRVILVADGCAAMRDQDHNASLHVVYRSFGDVRTTSEVRQLIDSGPSADL